METQNECRACFALFNSPAELRAHSMSFRAQLYQLTTKIQSNYMLLGDKTLPEANRNNCPMCDIYFGVQKELDDHIWAHQSEVAKLSDEIKAAVWHLPTNDHGSEDCDDSNATHDEDDDENSGMHDEHGKGLFRCPHPRCNKPPMSTMQGLTRHYCSHVGCNEICVSCRKPFTLSSTYMTHVRTCLNLNSPGLSFAKHRAKQLYARASHEIKEVEDDSPNKMLKRTQPDLQDQTKRRRIAENDAVQSSQVTLPDILGLEPSPGPGTNTVPGADPNFATFPDIHLWDAQMFPTPPSSSLGVDAASHPHLSDTYAHGAFPPSMDALLDHGASRRAPLFQRSFTIPLPYLSTQGPSTTYPVYEPATAVYTGSSVCNQVEELIEPGTGRSDEGYSFTD